MGKHDRDTKVFTREMLRNLQAGMVVLTSLRLLYLKSDIFSPDFLDLIRRIRSSFESGAFLYEAMMNQKFFPESYVDLVRQCETSDYNYLELFQKLAATYDKQS